MKNLVVLMIVIILTACNKKSPPATPTPASPSTPSMNTTETALVKKWNLKMRETYNSFSLAATAYFNNPATTYVEFLSATKTNTTGAYVVSGYECVEGTNAMVGMQQIWTASVSDTIYGWTSSSNPNNLNTAFRYPIILLSSDSLIFSNKISATQGAYNIWYFHK